MSTGIFTFFPKPEGLIANCDKHEELRLHDIIKHYNIDDRSCFINCFIFWQIYLNYSKSNLVFFKHFSHFSPTFLLVGERERERETYIYRVLWNIWFSMQYCMYIDVYSWPTSIQYCISMILQPWRWEGGVVGILRSSLCQVCFPRGPTPPLWMVTNLVVSEKRPL